MKKPYNLDLHIDRLVLHGFDDIDWVTLGAAVERELGRLFQEQGPSSTLHRERNVEGVRGGTFNSQPKSDAAVLGAQIARAVFGGLSQ